jgi:hypothetical protein
MYGGVRSKWEPRRFVSLDRLVFERDQVALPLRPIKARPSMVGWLIRLTLVRASRTSPPDSSKQAPHLHRNHANHSADRFSSAWHKGCFVGVCP